MSDKKRIERELMAAYNKLLLAAKLAEEEFKLTGIYLYGKRIDKLAENVEILLGDIKYKTAPPFKLDA